MSCLFNCMDYVYEAEVLRIVDGDTVYLRVYKEVETDFGFHVKERVIKEYSGSFRIARIDAPEPRGRKAKKEAAKKATNRLTQLLDSAHRIVAKTYKDPDNFGRYLVELICYIEDPVLNVINEINVSDQLLAEGLVVPYER